MAEGKRTFNPIDPDKIAEDANLLPYGSSVSAPAFKAVGTPNRILVRGECAL